MAEEFYERIMSRINKEIDLLKSGNKTTENHNPATIYANMIEISRCGTIKNIIDEEYNRLADK